MNVDFIAIGKRVKATRLQRRMTQAELAEKTGMSDVYISRIETGARSPSLGSLIKIALMLDCSLDSLALGLPARLPKIHREFAELLAVCDITECGLILKTASAYKKMTREEKR